jgi:hypothetical protein
MLWTYGALLMIGLIVLDLAIRRIDDSIGLESLTNAWHSLTTCIKVKLKAKFESSPEKAMDF